ncbi:MAG TPA: hypothetical protein VF411_08650, partial [Bacteroidia bacterium]
PFFIKQLKINNMAMVNSEKYLSPKLKRIWANDLYKDFRACTPLAPANILKNSLLFIGINPSHAKIYNGVDFYPLTQEAPHPYFKKFETISKETKLKWTHFDLLYMRETKQNEVKKILDKPNGKEYINEQLLLSKGLFDLCKPKVIVVNNAFARDLMFGEMKMNFVFNENIGTHFWNNKTPVFFTSGLTGQRALDNGSYKRLVWHIKRALTNLTKTK